LEEKVQQPVTMRMQNQATLAAGAHRGRMAKQSIFALPCALEEQVPALICNSSARRILCAAAIWGGYLVHRSNEPPQIFGEQI